MKSRECKFMLMLMLMLMLLVVIVVGLFSPAINVCAAKPEPDPACWRKTSRGYLLIADLEEVYAGPGFIDPSTKIVYTGEGSWYYAIDADGYMLTNCFFACRICGKDRETYIGSDGIVEVWPEYCPLVIKDEKTGKEKFYMFGTNDKLFTGWMKKYYHTNDNDDSFIESRYYFNEKGKFGDEEYGLAQTGWLDYNGHRYYFNDDYYMQTGWVTIGDKQYYFEESGDDIGVLRKERPIEQPEQQKDNEQSKDEEEPTKQTGWVERDGNRYYYDKNGKMKTGWLTYKKARYYFNKNGKMKTGWLTYKSNRYYFKDNGKMKTGWLTYKSNRYYFKDNGKMKTGWLTYNNARYYFKKNGKMASGETLKIKGKKYTFAKNGKLKQK